MSSNVSDLVVNGKRLLKIYSYYSLLLALLIMAVHATGGTALIGHDAPNASLIATVLYVMVAASFVAIASLGPHVQLATSYFFLETAILSVLMFASGGLDTGFSSLILICVVIANLLAPGVLGFAVAAWTTLAILVIQHFWPEHYQAGELVNSGVYGFLCFLLAALTQALSRRLNSALELARDQSLRLRRLSKISWQALADLPNGIIACDRDNRILFFNQQAQRWLGISDEESLPQPLLIALTEPGRKHALKIYGESLLVSKMPLPDSMPGDYLVFMEDQSRIAATAQQLKLASLGRLTASIAHEIRNPLSALRQASQLLAETPYLKEEELYLSQVIEQHCMRINRTVEDILQLSRKRQPAIEVLRLKPWLEHFREQFMAMQKGQSFQLVIRCHEHQQVAFDPDHLQQILHNLCANGLRYAIRQQPDNARLVLSAQAQEHNRLLLDVLDNGTGIADEQIEQLFEPFFTTEHNGTGLGLYLCRELCEANQANIQYHRTRSGSCFRLTLRTDIIL
ncbi:PAS domain-containing sensor histidine kinase [Candidatus Thalassolituus haligoni]|uniref:sensor histidine kinase n=1 Tax=Candidatus Thalassolituus haligoni TaxID=3100113 RepID=UPI0035197149|tara:strand:- start:842 stop:2380 length:1539 start_codon:yes stop_codon:yes gene_type:complete